jgi:hypothetical protein
MSVADNPFDSAWKIAKAPFYHSVNTDTSDPEVAEKLWALRDELMDDGISFDTGGGFPNGGRDWELDYSLRGATPDEVMIRMRDAGIPFTSTMRYVDEEEEAEEEALQDNWKKDEKLAEKDAEGIGESKCPECDEWAMVIRESDDSISLGCGHCGFSEEYQGGDFDEGVSKQFDQQRAGMARMVEQEQMPFEDEEVEVNLDGGGGEPDKCCLEALQLYQELTGDYGKGNPWIWSKGVEGGNQGDGGGDLDCDELRGWLEWVVYEDFDSPRDKEYQAAKKVLEQWDSCISEDFSGDFTASGDVFEDSWNIAKFEDEEVNVDLGNPNGIDPCCWAAFTDPRIEGWFFHDWSEVELESEYEASFDSSTTPCDWFRKFLESMPRTFREMGKDPMESKNPEEGEKQAQTIEAVLADWDACSAKGFSGDFTASGDVFEDAWSVAKKERCWLCEKVKDSFGRYPNLPYYPPNWKRPCDCAGDF